MDRENVRWFKECAASLFQDHKDTWVYKKVAELCAATVQIHEEEIIKDTRMRFMALVDYTLDVFTGGRMENKSYQIPFDIYVIAKSLFAENVAAVASEAVMSIANWDYRVRSNILRLILFDDNPEKNFLEKMTLFFMALEETKALEKFHDADSDESLAEFYPEFMNQIESLNYEYVKDCVTSIRNSDKPYYLVYSQILWKATEYCLPSHLHGLYAECQKEKNQYSKEGLDRELVDFIKMDMYEYINRGYPGSYSPFWIFGSEKYKQNIDFIMDLKYEIEFESVRIKYLSIKEKGMEESSEEENVVDMKKWRKVHGICKSDM